MFKKTKLNNDRCKDIYSLVLKLGLVFGFSFLIYSIRAHAACSDLVGEMKAMKQAQVKIQNSLISNHETYAQTLESYGDALNESAGRAYKSISGNIKNSAESIRIRGSKAQKLADKLESSTEQLVQRIARCLK
jgi:hypothetical protein